MAIDHPPGYQPLTTEIFINKGIQLRACRRPTPPVARRHRKRQHLRHRPMVDAKTPRRLSTTDPLNTNCVADPRIQLRLGDAIAALGRKVELTDENIAAIDQTRDKSPSWRPCWTLGHVHLAF